MKLMIKIRVLCILVPPFHVLYPELYLSRGTKSPSEKFQWTHCPSNIVFRVNARIEDTLQGKKKNIEVSFFTVYKPFC